MFDVIYGRHQTTYCSLARGFYCKTNQMCECDQLLSDFDIEPVSLFFTISLTHTHTHSFYLSHKHLQLSHTHSYSHSLSPTLNTYHTQAQAHSVSNKYTFIFAHTLSISLPPLTTQTHSLCISFFTFHPVQTQTGIYAYSSFLTLLILQS